MNDDALTIAMSLPTGLTKFWHLKASPPGGKSNGTVVSEISFGGGAVVPVGAGGVVVVGTGVVPVGGTVPVGVGTVVPVGAGGTVPVGGGFVAVGGAVVVPPGIGDVAVGGAPPDGDAHVFEHVTMSWVTQKHASMQVAHVPHAGAFEHPVT